MNKNIFTKICKGDGRGAYLVARGSSYCTYEPTYSPPTPRSPYSEKSTLYDGTVYEGERRCPARRAPALIVHGLVFLAYSTLLVVLLIAAMRKPDCDKCSMYDSPASEVVGWSLEKFGQADIEDDIYAGYPRPELEVAWDGLLEHTDVRLSREEVAAIDRLDNAVPLADGGYAATLNVFRELQCIKWLHTQVYEDVYFPNLNDTGKENVRLHTEQCLVQLRQAALCHADVGIVTYGWDSESHTPKPQAEYQCAKIEPLLEWTKERSINIDESNRIANTIPSKLFLDKARVEKHHLGSRRRSSMMR